MQRHLTLLLLLSIVIGVIAAPVSAQTITYATDFTYQGYLEDGGTPVDATCDFTFALFDAESGGNPVGTVQTASAVSVSAGVFSAALDFGIAAFNGQDRWLEIAVNDCAGGGTFTTLTPRQRITPAPYALALYGLRTEPNTTSPNVIGGFVGNSVTSSVVGATVSGGGSIDEINRVTDNYGTVGGGTGNLVGDDNGNTGDRQYATVGGGRDNVASGGYATVPGGRDNVASGGYAFAAGRLAVADDAGAFVWADSTDASFESSTANQFSVRAAGGVRLFSNSALTTGCTLPAGGSGWVCTSDRAAKEAFETVDPREVLAAVAALPVSTWNFIGTDTRHMGPVAQDFYAAFGLGEGDTGINSLDADGVALAAIQGLNLELGARDAQLAAQAAQLTALQVMLAVMLVTGAAGFIVMYRALAQMKRALNA